MVQLLKYITVIFFIAGSSSVYAQSDSVVTDSSFLGGMSKIGPGPSSSIQVPSFFVVHDDYTEVLEKSGYISQDTSLTNFQYYHPLYRKYVGFQHLGNIGSAYKNLYFTPQKQLGFDFGIHSFDAYLFDAEHAAYYDVDTPITQLWYNQGAQNQIYLRATHTQNFGERFNFGVNFRRLTSDGLYFNQATDYYNTQLVTNYTNPTYKYKVYGNVTFNRMKNVENGGITSDSLFGTLTPPNRLPAVLLNAQNTYRSNAYFIKQEYSLKKVSYSVKAIDSLTFDTIYQPAYRANKLIHEVSYSNNSWTYTDAAHDSLFYQNFYKDTLATFDSNNYKVLTNKVALLAHGSARKKLLYINYKVIPYFKNQLIQLYELNGYSTNINNNSIGLDFDGTTGKSVNININAEKYLSGYNKDDQNLKVILNKDLKNYRTLALAFQIQKVQPGFSQRYYRANNYFFYNPNFVQEETNRVRLTYVSNARVDGKQNNHFMVSAEHKSVNNYIYYDIDAQVQQAKKAINVTSFTLKKNFTFGKIHFDNDLVYQISDNDSILRLPDFMSKHGLYYQSKAYHNVLDFQAGVNVFYTTDFRGYAYSPSLRQFYLQDEVTIGGYPLYNVFVTGKVKSFLISFKMEHINEGYSGNRYYASAHHPLNGRVFRLGLAWRFID